MEDINPNIEINSMNLPHEDEVEEEAQNQVGIMKNFRIAKCERERFFLFGIIFFIIGFIYSFMRILKDSYVMGRQDPNCILYIKMFYILPLSFGIIIGINYLLGTRTVSKIFTAFSVFFMILFSIFGSWVLLEESIGWDRKSLKDSLENSNLNSFLKYFTLTLIEPLATLVYIVAELWGSLMLAYLFLSFLNESCSKRQHDRFIPPLFIITNLSLLFSALVTTGFLKLQSILSESAIIMMMSSFFFIIAILVFVMLLIKYHLEVNVISKPIFIPVKIQKKKKDKVGFKESFGIMKQSRFLMAMCSIVFIYNCLYNLLESVYKNGVKASAEELKIPKDVYSVRLTNYDQYITSIAVICLNLTSFSHLVDIKSWSFVALISPVVCLFAVIFILGFGIYNSALKGDSLSIFNSFFSGKTAYLSLENYLGMISLAAMKIFKYSAFDVTKERISMRVESRYRPKFKSIFDGIFNKVGKSVGAFYGIILGSLFHDLNLRGLSPITTVVSVIGVIIWFGSIGYLGRAYDHSIKAHENIDIDLREEESEEMINKDLNKDNDLNDDIKADVNVSDDSENVISNDASINDLLIVDASINDSSMENISVNDSSIVENSIANANVFKSDKIDDKNFNEKNLNFTENKSDL